MPNVCFLFRLVIGAGSRKAALRTSQVGRSLHPNCEKKKNNADHKIMELETCWPFPPTGRPKECAPREPKGNSQGAQRAPLWPKGPPETTKGSPRDPTGSAMAHPRAHSLEAAKKAGFPAFQRFPALQGERPKEPKGSPKGAHREPKGPARPFGLPVKTTMKTSVKTSMKDQ